MRIILIAGVPSTQVLPGFLITAPPSVCVPDVIGALTVWIQNQARSKITIKQDTCKRLEMTWKMYQFK